MGSFLKKPFYLGNLKLHSNIFSAPLAGCSDYPFRKMVHAFKPGLNFCEMVKMDALVRHDAGTFKLLHTDSLIHPIGAQLCGAKLELAADSARILEDLGFDVIDLNCGCPVDKVTKDGSGSGLLKQPWMIGDILDKMIRAVKVPVTVKIRLGWDDDHIVCEKITQIAELVGAKAITIHGRTREQGYSGKARWNYIKNCKDVAKTIKVIGNGDVFTPQDAYDLFNQTGCDGILVARGTMGAPYIFEDIEHFLEYGIERHRSQEEILAIFKQHFAFVCDYAEDRKALLDTRRIASWYLKTLPDARDLKEKVFSLKEFDVLRAYIDEYSLPSM
jgi:tRNA-dihydrouridine synthase B